jgi:hypothetical protein
MNRMIVISLLLVGCGGGWADADTKSATDAVRAQMAIESICADDDAGTCKPSQIRALERMAYCANASMLFRHGQAVPDAGIQCQQGQ